MRLPYALSRSLLLALAGSLALLTSCADEERPPWPSASRSGLTVDIWSEDFEAPSYADSFTSFVGTTTNTPPNSYVGPAPADVGAPAGSSDHLLFRAGGASSGPATPTYGYEARKLLNTADYRNVTLTFYRRLTGLDGPVTVNGTTLTDRWIVRYSTVASPAAQDWVVAQSSTTSHPGYLLQTIDDLPASSTLWLSFLADFQPQEPTDDEYAFNDSAVIDDVVVTGDRCESDAECSDGNDCTDDDCNVGTGICTSTPFGAGAECTDRVIPGGSDEGYCDGAGTCVQCTVVGHCPAEDNDVCTTGVACTNNVCTGSTVVQCSDGVFCNGLETCHPVDGCQPGVPLAVSDGIDCTEDECDEASDQVTHITHDEACDDFSACTDDACSATTGCSHEPIIGGVCPTGGYCGTRGDCVECLETGDCAPGLTCVNESCVCTPLTCQGIAAECGMFANDGCGNVLDCTGICPGGDVCDLSAGYEDGVCSSQCSDGLQESNEQGRDCGGVCAKACEEAVCGDGMDEDQDGSTDCDDFDCVDAGECDRCSLQRLGVAAWPDELSPSRPSAPTSYSFTLRLDGCTASLSVSNPGAVGHFDVMATNNSSFAPLIACLTDAWANVDEGATIDQTVLIGVQALPQLEESFPAVEVEVPLRELFAFDANKGRVDALRLVVRTAMYDGAAAAMRLSFQWEAIGYHDAHSDCLACTDFDDGDLDPEHCTSQCRCDIGEGGCSSDDECRRGMTCEPRGSWFSYHVPGLAVCVPEHCADGVQNGDETAVDCGGDRCGACPTCDNEPGCSPSCACEDYEGPCSRDADCEAGSVCGTGNGRRVGLPHLDRVCWPDACESPSACGTPACGPCDECAYVPAGCQVGVPTRDETLRLGSSSMRSTPATFVNAMDLVEEVGPHVLRTKEGAGDGVLSLFEGPANNYALLSTDLHEWSDFISASVRVAAPVVGSGVFGARVFSSSDSGNHSTTRALTLPATPELVTASVWIRKPSGTALTGSIALLQDMTAIGIRAFSPTAEWSRFDATATVTASPFDAHYALNAWGTATVSNGYNLDIALPQVELGAFPTSWISSYGLAEARDLDRVTIGRDIAPPWLYRDTFTLEIEPIFGSDDLATHAQTFVLIEYGESDQWLGLESDGAGVVSLVAVSGFQRIALLLPAFERGTPSMITVSPSTGELRSTLTGSVARGATWQWPDRNISIGARSSGSDPDSAYAWIGQPTAEIDVPSSCAPRLYPDRQPCGDGAAWCENGRCVASEQCGNGLLDEDGIDAPIELCDDGNNLAGDGCSPECHPEPISFQLSDVVVHEPGVRVHHIGIDGRDRMLLVWQAIDGEGSKILARRLTAGGIVATDDDEAPIEIALDLPGNWPAEPQVVGLDDGGWVVAWASPAEQTGASRIALRSVALDGEVGAVALASMAEAGLAQVELEPRVTALGDGFLVAWVDTSTTGVDHRVLRARHFDADLLPLGAQLSIAELGGNDDVEVALASRGTDWAAVWTRANDLTLRVRRFGAAGPLESPRVLASRARSPSIAALPSGDTGTDYAIAWSDTHDYRARALELIASATSGRIQEVADGDVGRPEVFPVVGALGDDAFVVAFSYADGFRDSDFRVLNRGGRLHTPSPEEHQLRNLLTGPSNQRGVSITGARNGVWVSWSDDGMPRQDDPRSLPNGLRMFLLGCADCDVEDLSCFNAADTLLPDDIVSIGYGAQFGRAFAIDGNRIMIGAPTDERDGIGTGRVWVYRRHASTWIEEAVLAADDAAGEPDGGWGPHFGTELVLLGSSAAIAAPTDNSDTNVPQSGAVYLMEEVDGEWEQTKLYSPDGPTSDQNFGTKLDMDEDWLVIGAKRAGAGSNTPAVYFFERVAGDYIFRQKLTLAPPLTIAYLQNVVLSGDTVFASTITTAAGGLRDDRVFVLRLVGSTWEESQVLLPMQDTQTDQYGFHIEVDGDLALVSALGHVVDPEWRFGGIYVYWKVNDIWQFDQLITEHAAVYEYSRFGYSVELDEHHMAAISSQQVTVFERAERGEDWPIVGVAHDPTALSFGIRFATADFLNGQLVTAATTQSSDLHAAAPGLVRLHSCSSTITCGDGLVTRGEECDDGNRLYEGCEEGLTSCAACTSFCQWYWPSCGDGTVQSPGEECDTAGDRETEYCSGGTQCQVCTEACVHGDGGYCGDGLVEPGEEECDDGNAVDTDGCTSACELGCVAESTVDTTCNGLDDDCDSDIDEDYSAPTATCGLGACASTAVMTCVAGVPTASCTPGSPSGADTDCDGVNEDCDTRTDEGYGGSITCGAGVCARTGSSSCNNGTPVSSCTPGAPTGTDTTCNGVDEDCDGSVDEGYVSVADSCGLGICARTGTTSCVSGSVSSSCVPGPPSTEYCNTLDDDCDGTVDDSCVPNALRLETGFVSVGATPVTINLKHTYGSPVIVTTVHYQNNTLPVVTRLQAVGHTSFQLYLQIPAGQTPVAEKVHYMVVEEGVWDIDGMKIEAHKVMSTATSRNGAFTGQPQTYGQSYTAPVVLGQVMSSNDPGFSAFWSAGSTTTTAPSATNLQIGLHVSTDPDITRAPETLGYVVVETASSTFAGVQYITKALTSPVRRLDQGLPHIHGFTHPALFVTRPEILLLVSHSTSSNRAGWLYGYRDPSATGSSFYPTGDESNHGSRVTTAGHQGAMLAFEKSIVYPAPSCGNTVIEPGETCDEGNVVTEYCSGGVSCSVCTDSCVVGTGGYCGDSIRQPSEACDDGNVTGGDACSSDCQTANPRFETGTVAVTPGGVTVALEHTYHTPVVIASLEYANNTNSVVVRINNVTSTSFNMYLQSPTGLTLVADNVTYMVVEQGVWNIGGFQIEAHRRTAIQTSTAGNPYSYWAAEHRAYGQLYTTPVVIGQVMSTNDPLFSVFWASAGDPAEPPSSAALYIGQHTGDEQSINRTPETLGYVVIDNVAMNIGGVDYKGIVGPGSLAAPPAIGGGAGVTGFFSATAYIGSTLFPYTPRAVISGSAGAAYHLGDWAYKSNRASPMGSVSFSDRSGHLARSPAARRVNTFAFQEDVYYPPPTCGNSIMEPGEDCDVGDTILEYCPMGQSCTTCSERCKLKPGGFCGDNVLQAGSGEVCDDGNVSSGDACNSDCSVATPRLEVGNVAVGSAPVVVELENAYIEPVIVTTVHYANNTLPVVTRIDDVTSSSFEIRLQVPTGQTPVSEIVTYGVMERGVWMIDGLKVEARTMLVTQPDYALSQWIGYEAKYGHAYSTPVVLGQVMSSNNARYSTFWDCGRGFHDRPTAQSLWIGMSVGQDPDRERLPELLGYWVMEQGAGSIGGIEYRAVTTPQGTYGVVTHRPHSTAFGTAFAHAPEAVLISAATSGSAQGAWAYGYDFPPASRVRVAAVADTTGFSLPRDSINTFPQIAAFGKAFAYPPASCGDEVVAPGEDCDDGGTVTEYCAGGTSCVVCDAQCQNSPGGHCGDGKRQAAEGEVCDDGNTADGDACSSDCEVATPKLETGIVVVGSSAVTVSLANDYASPVVVTTIQYANNTIPVVTRLSNVDADSFDVRLVNTQDSAVVAENVMYIVMEEGVWQIDGQAIEAQKRIAGVTSTRTEEHWVPERAEYGQPYTSPVVIGQVMTSNDPRFSIFYSSDGIPSQYNVGQATATHLYVSKHTGEDPIRSRADEEIGFIVLEAGAGTIGGVSYRAGNTPWPFALGVANGSGSPPATHNFSSAFSTVPEIGLATLNGAMSVYGAMVYLYGSAPLTATSIRPATDQTGHEGRISVFDKAAWLVFEDAFIYPAPP